MKASGLRFDFILCEIILYIYFPLHPLYHSRWFFQEGGLSALLLSKTVAKWFQRMGN